MVQMNEIRNLSRAIAREFHPRRIVLFGSYAWGKPTRDSDVDLFVVLPHRGRAADKSVEIRLKLRPQFPLDLIVRTPQSVARRLGMGDSFVRNILQRGKVLYEASDS